MDGETLVGIITERHYARSVVLKGKTSPKDSGPGYHGKARHMCAARTKRGRMYGPDD